MNEELNVLKIVAACLEKANIPYMITGSIAANFYAVPRMTRDIDIVLSIKSPDTDQLLQVFKDNFYIDAEMVKQAIREEGMFNILHNQSVVKIDFIIRKSSPYRELEFSRRRLADLKGTKLWVVSPEDLILSKLEWAKDSLSEMQIKDVQNLLKSFKDLDISYIQKWISLLKLEKIYERTQK